MTDGFPALRHSRSLETAELLWFLRDRHHSVLAHKQTALIQWYSCAKNSEVYPAEKPGS